MRRIDHLTRSHALLDERIDELGHRPFLSMAEQVLLRTLKKKKLAVKDALARELEARKTADER